MGFEAHQAEVEVTTNAPFEKSIAAFNKDAGWRPVEKETEKDGKLRSGVEAFKLQAADFSSLK